MGLTKSEENYLRAILILRERHGTVRAVDVANYLSITRASVSGAVKHLQSSGFLITDEKKRLQLTQYGEKLAQAGYQRQLFFTLLLQEAGIEYNQAEREAGELVQAISDDSYEKLKHLLYSCGIIADDSRSNMYKQEETAEFIKM